MSGTFAYHPPSQPFAYAPRGDEMERQPDNMDAETHDVVSDQSRLGGARALPNLKERGA